MTDGGSQSARSRTPRAGVGPQRGLHQGDPGRGGVGRIRGSSRRTSRGTGAGRRRRTVGRPYCSRSKSSVRAAAARWPGPSAPPGSPKKPVRGAQPLGRNAAAFRSLRAPRRSPWRGPAVPPRPAGRRPWRRIAAGRRPQPAAPHAAARTSRGEATQQRQQQHRGRHRSSTCAACAAAGAAVPAPGSGNGREGWGRRLGGAVSGGQGVVAFIGAGTAGRGGIRGVGGDDPAGGRRLERHPAEALEVELRPRVGVPGIDLELRQRRPGPRRRPWRRWSGPGRSPRRSCWGCPPAWPSRPWRRRNECSSRSSGSGSPPARTGRCRHSRPARGTAGSR